jgi:hypothetical protein
MQCVITEAAMALTRRFAFSAGRVRKKKRDEAEVSMKSLAQPL